MAAGAALFPGAAPRVAFALGQAALCLHPPLSAAPWKELCLPRGTRKALGLGRKPCSWGTVTCRPNLRDRERRGACPGGEPGRALLSEAGACVEGACSLVYG